MGMESPDNRRKADDSYRARQPSVGEVLPRAPAEGAHGVASRFAGYRAVGHGLLLDARAARIFSGRIDRMVLPLFMLGVLTGIAEWLMRRKVE